MYLKSIYDSEVFIINDFVNLEKIKIDKDSFGEENKKTLDITMIPKGENKSLESISNDYILTCLKGKLIIHLENEEYKLEKNHSMIIPSKTKVSIHAVDKSEITYLRLF